MSDVPAPLDWHPFYRDKTWLLEWLERRGPYADLQTIQLPVIRPIRIWDFSDVPVDAGMNTIRLERRQCAGPAPYVGRPFWYVWPVGIDNLGRMIAGDAQIRYE